MDIDDNASIASTVENEVESDFEWPVKQILAEGQVKGQTRYLLEWEDYPLSAATWEPSEHIQQSMLEDWVQTKQKQQRGELPRFHIDEWRMALIQHLRDKYARHEMRNRERQRRGLELAHFDNTLEQLISEINSTPSDQPKVVEDNTQPVTTNTSQSAAQKPENSTARSRRSSIDDLFSDPDSDVEMDACSGYCDPANEEDVATPRHTPDAGSDLGSDAMDIDGGAGITSPAGLSPLNITQKTKSSLNNRSIGGIVSTSSGVRHVPETDMAKELPSVQRGEPANGGKKKKEDSASTPVARASKPAKRVSFSLMAPAKEKPSSKGEASLFVPDRSHRQVSSTSSLNPRSLIGSASNPAEEDNVREQGIVGGSLPKTCVIGPIKLTCSFHIASRPADSQMSLYAKIMELESFNFSHICTAQDFLRQFGASELSTGFWVAGTACPHSQADKLETISSYLLSSSFGLLCHGDGFCLVICPSKCADWRQSPFPTSPPPAGHLLYYLAFAPAPTFQIGDMSLEYSLSYSPGIGIFDKQLYHKLLPSNDQLDKTQATLDSFFLVFPPSAKPEEDLLCRWLKVFNRNCEIRSCTVSGHWAKFVDRSRGAVILHQDCVQLLHRLPHFSKLLHSRNEDYNFWVFRLPFCSPVSEPQTMDGYMEQVGIALDLAFPPGVAVMAPPSFFISQPMQAYNLVKWIWQNFSSEAPVYRHGKLVVCHDLANWLLSLMTEKSEASPDVRECKQTLEVRMKTYMLITKLLDQDTEGTSSSVVYAPVYIDGNDEQSLVNWFGWWSVSQIDKFRKFSVICSDNDDNRRLSRHITRSTLRSMFSKANGGSGTSSDAEHANLKLVPSDTLQDLETYIRSVIGDSQANLWNPLVICPWAVHQHEGTSASGDVSQWVNFFAGQYINRKVSGKGHAGRKNTQLGFFYMADDTRTGADLHDEQSAHPWVAFVRPMELFKKPWKNSELLIWDYRLRDVTRQSQTISESDLSLAQRNLITEVTKQYAKLNLPLGKVWAGGFKASKMYPHPIDMTLDWMRAMVTNVKSWLPLNHDHLLNRGWSLVRSRSSPSMSHSPTSSRYAASSGSAEPGDYEEAPVEAQRVLFGPPNAGSASSNGYQNRLYEWAMSERVPRESEYTYVPTLEWYREQQESGRGFEHIRVLSWKAFFDHYKIDDPEK